MVIAARMPSHAARDLRGLAAALAAGRTGPGIGRRAAQQLARTELARGIYKPSIEYQVLHWLGQRVARFFAFINVHLPGGWWALVSLIAAIVLVAAAVVIRVRPAGIGRRASGVLVAGEQLTARDHRDLSERSAAEGDYSAAIIEGVRAIAAGLEERGVLPAKPGRTAAELAAEAGQQIPALAGQLRAATLLFDEVRYGGRTGTAAGYRYVRDLDGTLQTAKPLGRSSAASTVAAGATL